MDKITTMIINQENDQKLIEATIDESDLAYEEAKKELTLTSQYHDWSDTVADQVHASIKECYDYDDNLLDEHEGMTINDVVGADTVAQYNQYVASYNQYGDLPALNGDAQLDEDIPTVGI